MKRFLQIALIIIAAIILLFSIAFYSAFYAFDFDDGEHYTKEDLIKNYKAKEKELMQLKAYYNRIVPPGKIVDIEFENDHTLARIVITNTNSIADSTGKSYFADWHVNTHSKQMDSILAELAWTKQTLSKTKTLLDNANCISVKNGEPTNIGYQRSGLGKYYYNLFDQSIPKELRQHYNDGCTYILYNNKLALEYGGGAIGSQCFEDFNAKKNRRQN